MTCAVIPLSSVLFRCHPMCQTMKRLLQTCVLLLVGTFASAVPRKLVLRELKVPPVVDVRDDATLTCRFDLGGQRLYSVKWYKDEFEFYRYMPDHFPPNQSFTVPGVTLNEAKSNMENVTLTRLTFNSSGTYRCEVSTEGPNFETVFLNSNMTIVALPLSDPMIEGVLTSYSVGDTVRANCTSSKSNPPSVLSWYINGAKAEHWFLEQMPVPGDGYSKGSVATLGADWLLSHTPSTDEVDSQGLHTRTLGLLFTTERRFFQDPEGVMELRCAATVGDRQWDRVVSPSLATLTNEKLAQERLANSASLVTSCCILVTCALACSLKTVLTS